MVLGSKPPGFLADYKAKSIKNQTVRDKIRSPVAQSVEQAAVNRLVAGSSPARGAIKWTADFFCEIGRLRL